MARLGSAGRCLGQVHPLSQELRGRQPHVLVSLQHMQPGSTLLPDQEAKGQRPELEKQEEPDPRGSEVRPQLSTPCRWSPTKGPDHPPSSAQVAMEEPMEGGLNSCEDPRLGLPPKRKQSSEACSERKWERGAGHLPLAFF